MGKKEDTPLQATVKEDDAIKKAVEKIIKTGESQLKKKDIENKAKKELYESLKKQEDEIEEQIEKLNGLELENEPSMKENKFTSKKKEEVKKLNTVKEKLVKLQEKAKPEEDDDDETEDDEEDDDSLEEVSDAEESGEDEADGDSEEEKALPKEKAPPQPKKRESKEKEAMEIKKSSKKAVVAKEESEEESEEEESEEEEEDEDESGDEEPKVNIVKEKAPEQKSGKKEPTKPEESEEESEEEESEEEESEEEEEPPAPQPKKKEVPVKSKAGAKPQDEEEEESEEEEEESEEESGEEDSEEDEHVAKPSSMGKHDQPRKYEALVDFVAEEKGDLSFKTGEILMVLEHSADGWLTAQNSSGKKGLVPITYLKDLEGDEEDSEEESEDSEEDSEDDDEAHSPRVRTPRSGRMLWKNIKQAVKEEKVTDMLLAMGAIPPGYRDSTLARMKNDPLEHFTMKAYMAPKLSPSCLAFRDLHLDPQHDKIRVRPVKIHRIIQIQQARQIPAPGAGPEKDKAGGLEIKSRHLRVCLFDGKNMLSNIHTIRVSSVDKTGSTWNFNLKNTDTMKNLEFGEFFIRSNTNMSDVGILFELCMSYVRTSAGQSGEFSCGWLFLPLFDESGKPVDNKQFDEVVSGGTPFEKGVDVDPSLGRKDDKAQTSLFRNLVSGNKQPRLVVRFQQPSKDQTELLNTLPDVLIGSTTYIQYLSFYRQILLDTLIKDSDDIQSTEPIHSPLLTTFPEVLDQPDLMDVLRAAWRRNQKKADKKDPQQMKLLFRKTFMESVYPLYHTADVQSFRLADQELESKRQAEITRLSNINKDKRFMAACLLSADATHKPFDISELAFSVIGPHCVTHRVV